jgi:site-specific DNA recombinase
MRAAIYLRVSTEEQRERQSIATQRDFAQRYCALHEIVVADTFADDGVSGTIPVEDRPEGARLLAAAREKSFTTVLVFKVDRLARDPRLLLNAVNDLEQLGVELKSMTEAFDSTSAAGRLLRTVLAAVAGHERDAIVERSQEGTRRRAREGGWLGGSAPYGYRVEGKGHEGRLVVATDPIPGTELSESEVVRMIFEWSGNEGLSCVAIASRLRAMGIPPASYRFEVSKRTRGRLPEGVWRAGGLSHLIRSTTYRGVFQYGKRPKKGEAREGRSLIEAPVPAIVDDQLWSRAQDSLRRNLIMSPRNAKHRYLLRGLIKCAHCGLTYVGSTSRTRGRVWESTYSCNGHHLARATKCPSKRITDEIEEIVWRDVEGFLRNPGPVLGELSRRMKETASQSAAGLASVAPLRRALAGKQLERDRILGLFRRGKIDSATLDQQLDEIERERSGLAAEIDRADEQEKRSRAATAQIAAARDLLEKLRARLAEPLSWDVRRRLVETLVEGIRAETVVRDGVRDVHVTVTYRFGAPEIPVANDAAAPRTPHAMPVSLRSAPASGRRAVRPL